MLRIGVTGGIGSGKSLVSAILRSNGIPVFDCDSRAKAIMASDISVRKELQSVSGIDFFPNGELDRGALAGYLFRMPENASVVNGVVHPRVIAELEPMIASGIESGITDACVVLRADKTVPVQYVVNVIDAVNNINAQSGTKHKVILATSPKAE